MESIVTNSDSGNKIRHRITRELLRYSTLASHHLEPFRLLTTVWLKDITLSNGTVSASSKGVTYSFHLSNYKFIKGNMTPDLARLYNGSYMGSVVVDIHEKHVCDADGSMVKSAVHRNVTMAEFPVMIDARDFIYNPECVEGHQPGTFVIKGKPRFIPMLKSLMNNYPFRMFNPNRNSYSVLVRSEHLDRKHRSTSTLEMTIDAGRDGRSGVISGAKLRLPFLKPSVPLPALYIAMGCTTQDFKKMVIICCGEHWNEELFMPYFIDIDYSATFYSCKEDALKCIAKLYGRADTLQVAINAITSEVLPHLNGTSTPKDYYIAYMFTLLILTKHDILPTTSPDCRHYTRIVDSGTSCAILYRMLFIDYIHQAHKNLRRSLSDGKPIDVAKIYNHKLVTHQIHVAFSTGSWSKKRKGVCQQLCTMNTSAIISQLRRISSSSINNDGKHVTPRLVQPESYGYECAAETPEGSACGLVYTLALLATVSPDEPINKSDVTRIFIEIVGDVLTLITSREDYLKPRDSFVYSVFGPQGEHVGWCDNVDELNRRFAKAKRSLSFGLTTTRFQDDVCRTWRLECDGGRLCRPLIVMENIHKIYAILSSIRSSKTSIIQDLFACGCVEYLTPAEEIQTSVAHSFNDVRHSSSAGVYTHCEITDVSFVGVVAALAPLFRHNQGPRLVYWIGMSKQVIGMDTSIRDTQRESGSVTTHSLWYGQRQLVSTSVANHLDMSYHPDYINVTLIIHPHPYNQEDAFVMNRASVDRGMFTSTSYRTHTSNCRTSAVPEKFERPHPKLTASMKCVSYDHLRDNGIPNVGTYLKGGDIVIGKTVPYKPQCAQTNESVTAKNSSSESGGYTGTSRSKRQKFNSANDEGSIFRRRCASTMTRPDEPGVVDSVCVIRKARSDTAKVAVRTTRRPEVGDKFASRHAQKGTVGKLVDPEDLPYSAQTGMIPDIVMSPLGIASRMTMGLLIEALMGKAAVLQSGCLDGIDDQDFTKPINEKLDFIKSILTKAGFAEDGTEIFIDGITGEMIKTPVMSGVVSYVKLNHMISRKAHARSTGPVHRLTRQPIEGRRRNGGLRFGQMESECLISHGGSATLQERTFTTADPFSFYVCGKCKTIGEVHPGPGADVPVYCSTCESGDHLKHIDAAYATKLLVHELAADGIKAGLEVT